MLKIFKFDNIGVLEEVEKFEKSYSICFPLKYKEFLTKYNGGDAIDTSFRINKISSDIKGFYGFKNAPENCNVIFFVKINILELFLEKDFFPIANDSLGNHIVIGIGKENQGKIYFYDHELNEFNFIINDLVNFFKKIKSGEVKISSIEERIKKREERNREVTSGLMKLWQKEIDEFSGRKQEIVEI